MKEYYLPEKNYNSFLSDLSNQYPVYAPVHREDFLSFEIINEENLNKVVIDTKRTIQPLKSFFIPAQRKISEYFSSSPAVSQTEEEEKIILGAKSCDLHALKISDSVYSGEEFGKEYQDPFYTRARNNTIIISSDCRSPDDNCFCTLVGSSPFPEEGFDLNFSSVKDGFVVQVASEKGEELIKRNQGLFSAVTEDMVRGREENRKKTVNLLGRINKEFKAKASYRELIEDSYTSSVWKQHSENCVDCGGCNQICPTCRCFLLADEKEEDAYQRYYLWDGCLLTGFGRVGAGANPRPYLHQRFANRLLCKFYFFSENIDLDACTGCGRCIAVCIGKIDMREVLRDLAVEKKIPVGLKNE